MHNWDDEAAKRLMSEGRKSLEDVDAILAELNLHEGAVVADLGCGSGYFTIPIASRVGGTGTVYAVDSSRSMMLHLKRNVEAAGVDLGRIIMLETDAARTGIPDRAVDVAFFANVLHDIGYKDGFINEVKRILKPGGMAVDYDWNEEWKESGPPMEIRLRRKTARELLEKNGLKVACAINMGATHYMLMCKLD